MESTDARQQLDEVARLQAATATEAMHVPPFAWVVLGTGAALFFGSYALDRTAIERTAPLVWTLFVVGWAFWIRHGNRVRPGPLSMAPVERRVVVLAAAGVLATSTAAVVVGALVSWPLAGTFGSLAGVLTGITLSVRRRRS